MPDRTSVKHDPTTRNMLESILVVEEEHAYELADLLIGRLAEVSS